MTLLINLIVWLVILGFLFWLTNYLPAPFAMMARVAVVVLALVVLLLLVTGRLPSFAQSPAPPSTSHSMLMLPAPSRISS